MKTSTMDGDFITVIQSKEVQGILDRSKKASPMQFPTTWYPRPMRVFYVVKENMMRLYLYTKN